MTAFYQTASFLEYHVGYLHVSFCRLVKCGSHDLGFYAAAHVGNLLRTLVDKKHNLIYFRMIVRDGIGY